jgi:hypothetical protein
MTMFNWLPSPARPVVPDWPAAGAEAASAAETGAARLPACPFDQSEDENA